MRHLIVSALLRTLCRLLPARGRHRSRALVICTLAGAVA